MGNLKRKEKIDSIFARQRTEANVRFTFDAFHHFCCECVCQSFDIRVCYEIVAVAVLRQIYSNGNQVNESLYKRKKTSIASAQRFLCYSGSNRAIFRD